MRKTNVMSDFFMTFQNQIIQTLILLISFMVVRLFMRMTLRKIGRKSEINEARIQLISRYLTITLASIALIIIAFIFGAEFKDFAFIFSSFFAVLGIALFAIWSILSNITSGIIMFFNFPYKIGDKIEIHDKDYPIKAIIEDIRAFQLHLRLENGDLITYPNNLMLQKAVTLIKKDAIEDEIETFE